VRAADRAASNGEPFDLEVIRDGGDIGDAVGQLTSALPVGSAVARTVVGNDPRTDLDVDPIVEEARKPRTRTAMKIGH
jgi:hypothetical protein